MAVGGPETDLALGRTPLDIEAAQIGAASPAMAIVGQNTPQVTTRQAPGVPPIRQGLNMSIAPAEYAWQPSQTDLGQRNVAQIQVDGFNVPVAQQGLPFGAIASRQQALAERKAKLQADTQKMLAGTDVFGKISDPYHVYGAEWGKYIQQDYQRFLQDEADAMFGGDRAQAANYLYTDPEGRGKLMSWAKAHDAAAKQSAGIGKRAVDILSDIESGAIDASPEERNSIASYLNGRDVNGIPISSGNIHDMLTNIRDAETAISAVEYRRKYLKDIDQFAEQMVSAGQAQKIPGTGKYLLPIETKKDLEAMVDGEVQTMLGMGMFGGDEKKARAFAEQNLRNKVEWDTKVIEPFESAWTKEAAKAKHGSGTEGKAWVGDVETGGSSVAGNAPVRPSGYSMADAIRGNVQGTTPVVKRLPIGEVVGGRMQNMGARKFTDDSGKSVEIFPQYIEEEAGNYYIVGKLKGSESEETKIKGSTDEGQKTTVTISEMKDFRVPVKGNDEALKSYLGGLDWRSKFGVSPTSGSELEDLLEKYK